jgi:UDP-N-acetylglucosamine--N-acetylmuramyl-(pentapeptide) pyrophosphoryl-undecaprenol N-acetylglucosamine transferase
MRGPAARPIVIAAGGTGGHVFPAEAVASALIARGERVVLMTDSRSGALDSPVFAGRERLVLSGAGLAGRGVRRAARAAVALGVGVAQARRALARLDARAVVAFGGYPSVPPVLAARSLARRPKVILHEQNAVLGRANRFLAPHADALALSFAETARVPPGVRAVLTGNPVRPAIASITPYAAPEEGGALRLLVLGGSLGARVFSDIVPDAVAALPAALRARLQVVQQCRAEDLERVGAAYARIAVSATLAPFFSDVAIRLSEAHLVIARAGASTVAELAVAGRPAILVPLPGAIDDHQSANARALMDAGAIETIAQDALTAPVLAAHLSALLGAPGRLGAMATASRDQARPDAARDLADLIDTLTAREARA